MLIRKRSPISGTFYTPVMKPFRGFLVGCLLLCCSHEIVWGQEAFDSIRALIPGEMEQAEEAVEAYHIQAVRSGEDVLLGQSFYLRGLIAFFRGEVVLAESYNVEALEHIPTDSSGWDMRSRVWNNLGIIYGIQGKYGLALSAFERSSEHSLMMGDTLGSVQVGINLGLLENRIGNFDSARKYFRWARQYNEKFQSQDGELEGTYFVNMASVFINEGLHWDSAAYYSSRAVNEFQSALSPLGIVSARLNQALVMIGTGQYEEGREELDFVDSFIEENGLSDLTRAEVAVYRGFLNNKEGNYNQSFSHLDRALDIYREQGFQRGVEETYSMMLHAMAGLGDFEGYTETQELFERDLRELQASNSKNRYAEVQQYYEDRRIDEALARQRQRVNWLDGQLEQASLGIGLKNKVIFFLLACTLLIVIIALYIHAKSIQAQLRRRLESSKSVTYQKDTGRTAVTPASHLEGEYSENPDFARLCEGLKILMEEEHLYKEPNLTMAMVARHLNTNVGYLAQVIKWQFGVHFNVFINQFRVSESVRLIENQMADGIQLKSIAFRVGFNSYRTFFRAFKGETGLTPQEYVNFMSADNQYPIS